MKHNVRYIPKLLDGCIVFPVGSSLQVKTDTYSSIKLGTWHLKTAVLPAVTNSS